MLIERNLIPYSASELPPGKWLIFAPHADDEVIGMGGAILAHRENLSDVTVCYVTDGAKGGDANIRNEEALSVCTALEATPVFLALPDKLLRFNKVTLDQFIEVINAESPDVIFFPSLEEFHPDHRVTASLVWNAQKSVGFKGEVVSYEISRQSEANILVDISLYAPKKREILELYQSQTMQNNYVEVMEAINKARTYTLPAGVSAAEAFFRYTEKTKSLEAFLHHRHYEYVTEINPVDNPVISVLVRTYNRPEYLQRCLNSVAIQHNHKQIELIVVNDGGCNIDEVVAEFSGRFRSENVINLPENRGRSASANIALSNATGRFVNFLEDDDEFHINHFSTFLWHWRRRKHIEVFYRGVRVLSDSGELVKTYNEPYDPGRLMDANFIPIHAITFTRKVIDMGCRFDESLEFLEDWDFWIQVSRLFDFHRTGSITATYHLVGSSCATPGTEAFFDPVFHRNRVKDKWCNKWTAVEYGRLTAYLAKNVLSSVKAEILK